MIQRHGKGGVTATRMLLEDERVGVAITRWCHGLLPCKTALGAAIHHSPRPNCRLQYDAADRSYHITVAAAFILADEEITIDYRAVPWFYFSVAFHSA